MRFSPSVIAAAGLALSLVGSVAHAEPRTLDGGELKKAVSGKTVFISISGFQLPINYQANGTMSGRVKGLAATFSGEEKSSDTGKWWVNGEQLCQKWDSWLEKKSYCYRFTENDGSITWHRNDGRSGAARIG